MGSARVGSNPANCEVFFYNDRRFSRQKYKIKLPPVGFEPTTPSLRDWCSTTELKRHLQDMSAVQERRREGRVECFANWDAINPDEGRGSVAEWSKALVLGTSLSGRGFESHRCQENLFSFIS